MTGKLIIGSYNNNGRVRYFMLQRVFHKLQLMFLVAAVGIIALACDAGFQRYDPVIDDAVEFCLQENSKEECRDVVRRPDGPTPHVVGSVPDDGTENVDPATKQIDIVFDQPMRSHTVPESLEVYLVSTVVDVPGGPLREELTRLSLEYSTLQWLDQYTLRVNLGWQQLPENAVIAYKPSTAFRTTRNMPIRSDEALRRFSVGRYETFFPLLETNQYDCFQRTGEGDLAIWSRSETCNIPDFQLFAEDFPLGQNGHYEDNTGAPPTRRLMNGPLQNAAHNFTVLDANENPVTIRPVVTEDPVTDLTWTSCSMPNKTLKRPPVFRTDGFYAAQPCTLDPALYSWSDAMASCGLLNQANNGAGYAEITNWRLPRFDELMTLADYGYYNGRETAHAFKGPAVLFDEYNENRPGSTAISKRYFPYKIAEGAYWTSTAVKRPAWVAAGQPEMSFEVKVVDFANGNYKAYAPFDPAKRAYVLCVSGDTPARSARTFSVNEGNGTVSDAHHGLMWQRCLQGQSGDNCETGAPVSKKWAATDLTGALNYCETLDHATYTDWRLPNLNELRSIYGRSFDGNLALDQTVFPNSPGSVSHSTLTPNYLTSTANVSHGESDSNTNTFPHVWTLNFGLTHFWQSLGVNMLSTRDRDQSPNASSPFARCVRSLP